MIETVCKVQVCKGRQLSRFRKTFREYRKLLTSGDVGDDIDKQGFMLKQLKNACTFPRKSYAELRSFIEEKACLHLQITGETLKLHDIMFTENSSDLERPSVCKSTADVQNIISFLLAATRRRRDLIASLRNDLIINGTVAHWDTVGKLWSPSVNDLVTEFQKLFDSIIIPFYDSTISRREGT